MINKLIKLSNELDPRGHRKESDWLDEIIKSAVDKGRPHGFGDRYNEPDWDRYLEPYPNEQPLSTKVYRDDRRQPTSIAPAVKRQLEYDATSDGVITTEEMQSALDKRHELDARIENEADDEVITRREFDRAEREAGENQKLIEFGQLIERLSRDVNLTEAEQEELGNKEERLSKNVGLSESEREALSDKWYELMSNYDIEDANDVKELNDLADWLDIKTKENKHLSNELSKLKERHLSPDKLSRLKERYLSWDVDEKNLGNMTEEQSAEYIKSLTDWTPPMWGAQENPFPADPYEETKHIYHSVPTASLMNGLTKLASHLDSNGFSKEADYLDTIIRKIAEEEDDDEHLDDRLVDALDGGLTKDELQDMANRMPDQASGRPLLQRSKPPEGTRHNRDDLLRDARHHLGGDDNEEYAKANLISVLEKFNGAFPSFEPKHIIDSSKGLEEMLNELTNDELVGAIMMSGPTG